MGNFASTRWEGVLTKRMVHEFLQLDIRLMVRRGDIRWQRGRIGKQYWLDWDDHLLLQLRYDAHAFFAEGAYLNLRYTLPLFGEQDYNIPLNMTFPPYGGVRIWGLCPDCDRRISKLYLLPETERFSCRICGDLTYESQRTLKAYRLLNKAGKIAQRMGGEDFSSLPPRPKGMHWHTYTHLCDSLLLANQEAAAAL